MYRSLYFLITPCLVLRSSRQLLSTIVTYFPILLNNYVCLGLLRCLRDRSEDVDQQQTSTSHLTYWDTSHTATEPSPVTCDQDMPRIDDNCPVKPASCIRSPSSVRTHSACFSPITSIIEAKDFNTLLQQIAVVAKSQSDSIPSRGGHAPSGRDLRPTLR
jgi:hypothetical protein